MIQNVTKKTLQVELLNMKLDSDKQHMYTLNMHIPIPNTAYTHDEPQAHSCLLNAQQKLLSEWVYA